MCLPMAPPCGCMLRVHPVFVSCVSPPRVCLIPACRPCRVSHAEPTAINVSAHGAALWGRGHGWPGGPRPERPPQHPAGQPERHVSDKAPGGPVRSALKLKRGCSVIHAWIIYTLPVCMTKFTSWVRVLGASCFFFCSHHAVNGPKYTRKATSRR